MLKHNYRSDFKIRFANLEFEVSESQLNLRKNALDRQTQLAESGLITSSQLENTQLAYSSSKQQFLNKQNLVKSSKNAIDKLNSIEKKVYFYR